MLQGKYIISAETTNANIADSAERMNIQNWTGLNADFTCINDGELSPAITTNENSNTIIDKIKVEIIGAKSLREAIGNDFPAIVQISAKNEIISTTAGFRATLSRFDEWQEINKMLSPNLFTDGKYHPYLNQVIIRYDGLGIQDIFKGASFRVRVLMQLKTAGIYTFNGGLV